jgi:hypothetical protein
VRKWLSVLVCVLTVAVVQAADVYHQVKEIAIGGESGSDYLIVGLAAQVHQRFT